jgi:NADH:ubiquinone oxidoreductase subunit 6 (subunit J)
VTGVDVAFWVLGALSVAFAWQVFRVDSMVRASYALLASFVAVAGILVLLLAEYLGVALVFMMALEMLVMALFMVAFMMNPAGLNPMTMVHNHRFSVGVGAGAALGLGAVGLFSAWPDRPLRSSEATIAALGHELLGDGMLVFECAGVTLLATMVGAVVLSSRRGRHGPADAGSRPPPLDPDEEDRR